MFAYNLQINEAKLVEASGATRTLQSRLLNLEDKTRQMVAKLEAFEKEAARKLDRIALPKLHAMEDIVIGKASNGQ